MDFEFLGHEKGFSCGLTLFAKEWEEMKAEKQRNFEKKLIKKADKFYTAVLKRKKIHTPLFTRIVFMAIKKMISGYQDNQPDKRYWKEKGWLSGQSKPF